MDTLLLVDDDAPLLELLRMHFEDQKDGARPRFRTVTARSAEECLQLAAEVEPSLVLMDMLLPDRSGIELIPELKSLVGEVPIVIITAHQDTASTIRAMKAGAFDYLHKPFADTETLDLVVRRALEMGQLSRRAAALAVNVPDTLRLDDIVSDSPRMQGVLKEIGKVVGSRASILLQGESGTGKELIARVIHTYSHDAPRPFVGINCSAIVDTLLESELFGHERGAFTGAVVTKPGKFELAEDGTVFLDEIGDLSLPLQAKLLRVLQEREFERVGGVKRLRLRARVVAATQHDLLHEVEAGRFRADLFQRLKVVTLELPALRDRREDLPRLVGQLLARINGKVHKRVRRVPEDVMRHLTALPWPGNVRELENALTRAVLLSPGEVLLREYLPELQHPSGSPNGFTADGRLASLDEVERAHLDRVYRATGRHKGKTCEILGISRPTLERKLKKHGLAENPEEAQGPTVNVDPSLVE